MLPVRFIFVGLALVLASCQGPNGLPIPPIPPLPPLPPLPGGGQPQPPQVYERPYRPYGIDEYRNGYDVGKRDKGYGYPADSRRAFDRYGSDSEPTFSEGYADGYDRRPPRR